MSIGIYDLEIPVYDMQVIAMEDSIFASVGNTVKRLSAYITENLKEFMLQLSDNYNLMTASTRKELASIKAVTARDLERMPDRTLQMYIGAPVGFGVPMLRIISYLEKKNEDVFKTNISLMEKLSKNLSAVLTDEKSRSVITKKKLEVEPDEVTAQEKELMNLLERGTGGKTKIETLVENKGRYLDGVSRAYDIFVNVKKRDFDRVNELTKEISEKVEAFRYLIEVEKEPITKSALEAIINEIDASAKMNTLMAKHQLMTFEVARIYIKIGNLIKKVTK